MNKILLLFTAVFCFLFTKLKEAFTSFLPVNNQDNLSDNIVYKNAARLKTFVFSLVLLFFINVAFAQRTSTAPGNWSAASTWANANITRTGTVTSLSSSTTVNGTGTLFLTELSVGSVIRTLGNTAIGTVASIASNTSLTLTANASNSVTAQTYRTTSGPPSPVDNVTIVSNHIVAVNGIYTCASLAIAPTNTNTATLQFSGGSSQLTVNGTVTLGNNGAPTRRGSLDMTNGGTIICQGFSLANTGANLFTAGTGTVQLTTTNTLPTTIFTSFNNLTISNGTTTNNATLTVSAALTGAGGLTNSSGGTLNLNGTSSITTLTNAGTAAKNGTGAITTALANFTNTGTFDINGSGAITGVTNNSGGTFNINGSNTVTGITNNAGGTLNINGSGAITGITNNGTVNLAGSGTITTFNNATAASQLNISIAPVPTISTLTATFAGNTVNYSGAAQTVIATTYSNLRLSGSGTKTFAGATTVDNGLIIDTGVVASLGTNNHTALTLSLNAIGQNSGSYGSSASAATYKNSTFFGVVGLGQLNVANFTCTAGTWIGATSTDWNTDANWCGGIPTATTDVVIPTGTTFSPTIAAGTTANCRNITINASATLTLANSATSLLNISGDFVNSGTFTAGAASIVSFVGGGSQAIGGGATIFSNLNINSGTTTLGVGTTIGGNLNIASGATLATANFSLDLKGNFTNSSTFTAGSSAITISGTAAQSIAGFTTTGLVSMTNTGSTVTFAGNVNGAGLTINGTGTLNLGTSLTHTFTGNWTRTAGTLNGGSSLLKVGGDVSGTGGTFTAGTGTVEFNRAGAQNLGSSALTYNNLTLSGSGTKTFGAISTVSGNWSMVLGPLANLGGFTHTAGTLVLGGAGPLLNSWGSTSSGAANTTNDYFTGTGIINVSSAPYPAIDNNYASYSSGVSGQVAGSSGEYANPPTNTIAGSVTLAAPAGSAFINVKFASYGSPVGTSPNFTIGTCHAFNSRTVTTGLLGSNVATIPASGSFNATFGDPCYGVVKSYNVVATYAEPFCATSTVSSFVINGSTPTGGNGIYTFLWEVSTTGPSSGYGPVSGTNNAEDYTVPAGINQTTYYRRTVTSGIYSDATIVIVQVTTGPPVQPISFTSATNCNGTATLTVSGGSLGLGGYAEFYSGSCGGTVVGTSNVIPASLIVSPTMGSTTYYVRYLNSCNKVAACMNTTVANTVSIAATASTSAVCFSTASQNAFLAYTATSGTPDRYSVVWDTAAITAGLVNQTDVTFAFVAAGGTLNTIAIPANVPAGTYTGTLTVKRNSTGCVSFMNSFTVTIRPAFTSGAINTTGETICNGGTPATTVGSATAASGGDTTITYSWRSSADGYVAAISGATSASYLPPSGLTTTTSYRRYAKDGTCNTTPSVATGTWTVTVRALFTSGAINTTGETICNGGTPATTIGSATAASGGDTTITYSWRSSADGYVAAISGATSATYLPPSGLTTTTSYRRYANDGTCNTIATVSTGTWTVTVVAVPVGPVIAKNPNVATVCAGTTLTMTLTTAGTGGTGTSQDEYRYNNGSGLTAWATTVPSFAAVVGTNTIESRRTSTGTGCTTASGNTLSWTVVAVPVGPVIAKNPNVATVCAGTTLTMTLTTAGTGGTGTSQDEYRYNNGSGLTAWATTVPSFAAVVGTNTIESRRTSTGTGCTTATGNTLSWTVVAVPVGPVIAKNPNVATVCAGTTLTMTLTTAGTGGTGTSQDEYRYNNGSGLTAWATTVPSFAAVVGTNTIESRRTSTGTGCTTATGNTLSWTVVAVPVGPVIAKNPNVATVCAGTTLTMTLTTAGTGGTGTSQDEYRYNNGSGLTAWATTVPSFAAVVGTNTIESRRTSTGTGCTTATGNTLSWTVVAVPVGPVIAKNPNVATVCAGTTLTMTLTTAGTGGTGTSQDEYRYNNGSGLTAWATTVPSFAAVVGTNTIESRRTSTGTGCTTATGNTLSWTVVAVPVGPVIAKNPNVATVCAGTTLTMTLTTAGTGGTGTSQDEYRYNNGSGLTAWATTVPSFTAVVGTNTIESRRTSTGTGCTTATGNTLSWTVNPNIPASVNISALPLGAICAGTSVTFTAAPTNGGTTPTYKWYKGGVLIPSETADTYTTTTLANGDAITCEMTSNATPCLTGSPAISNVVTMTVNALPTAPTISSKTDISCTVSTGSVTLGGLPSGTWTINPGPGAISDTGTSYTVTGLAVNSYTFTVADGNGCPSAPSAFVSILDSSSTTWNGTTWTNGTPNSSKSAIIASVTPNQPFTADIAACALTVDAGIIVTVPSGVTLTITNAVTTNGQLIFQNDASLVQDAATTTNSNSGAIEYQRSSAPMKNFDYTYWSSPVTGQSALGLSPNTFPDKYFKYNGTANAWVFYNGIMTPGVGYIIRTPKGGIWPNGENVVFPYSQPVAFKGVPNNGDYSYAVGPNEFNLVGNPYPSAIDADEFMNVNSDLYASGLYFWTHITPIATSGPSYQSSDYATYNGSGGTAASTGGAPPSGQIAAGQSFFVGSANITGSSFKFTNSMRVAGNNSQFFKMSKTKKSAAIEKNRVWLNLTNSGGAFKQLLVGYIAGATDDVDKLYDAANFNGNTYVNFYSLNNGKNYTIQGRAVPFKATDEVPLGYKSTIEGPFEIGIANRDGLLANQEIWLEDKKTAVMHDLTKGSYSFTAIKGTENDRFVLKYTNKTLGTDDHEIVEKALNVYVKNKKITIVSTAEALGDVFVYDLRGRLLYENKNTDKNEFVIPNLNSGDQFLIVVVQLANGKWVSKEIVF
ncbi:T9SS sorting signal type C domain-containing protein [Flavobacterium sp. N3904]|uniref:T9SS sorting signal type C domain-containing protein n=1 Tax=Flavobacterium sp. N3904 TaxID=2986835 RepID=UPI00222580C4|nr:T9SS sorting signal type C domain-containing protein [Flavobacterium sp. N3904]